MQARLILLDERFPAYWIASHGGHGIPEVLKKCGQKESAEERPDQGKACGEGHAVGGEDGLIPVGIGEQDQGHQLRAAEAAGRDGHECAADDQRGNHHNHGQRDLDAEGVKGNGMGRDSGQGHGKAGGVDLEVMVDLAEPGGAEEGMAAEA